MVPWWSIPDSEPGWGPVGIWAGKPSLPGSSPVWATYRIWLGLREDLTLSGTRPVQPSKTRLPARAHTNPALGPYRICCMGPPSNPVGVASPCESLTSWDWDWDLYGRELSSPVDSHPGPRPWPRISPWHEQMTRPGPGRESTGTNPLVPVVARTNPAWDQSGLAIWDSSTVCCWPNGFDVWPLTLTYINHWTSREPVFKDRCYTSFSLWVWDLSILFNWKR